MTWTQAVRIQAQSRNGEARSIALWRVAVLVGAIALWYLIFLTGMLPKGLLPNPFTVFAELIGAFLTPTYWNAVGATLGGALYGLIVAILIGIPVGLFTGRFRLAELSGRFLLDFGRAFPSIALIPVLIMMMGRGIEMKAFVVFFAVVFPIIIQTQHGARRIDPTVVETCDAFRIPGPLFLRRVVLPTAAPFILTGLRLAASISVLVSIGTEVITGAAGLGAELTNAQVDGNSSLAFAYIISAAALGWGVNTVIAFAQEHLIRWRPGNAED